MVLAQPGDVRLHLRWLFLALTVLMPLAGQAAPLRSPAASAGLSRSQAQPSRLAAASLRAPQRAAPSARLRQSRTAAPSPQRASQQARPLSQALGRRSSILAQQGVGELSTASLLVASASRSFRLGSAGARFAGPLAGVGSLGLGLHSFWHLTHAKSTDKKIEALHGLAWSLQGMRGLGYLFGDKRAWIEPTSQAFGVAGGLLQTALGLRRIVQGWKEGDRPALIKGGLDVGAGLCWAATSLSWANPYSLSGFIGFTLGQMAYNRRDGLKTAGRSCARSITRGVTKARQSWRSHRERRAQAALKTTPSPYAALSRALGGQ